MSFAETKGSEQKHAELSKSKMLSGELRGKIRATVHAAYGHSWHKSTKRPFLDEFCERIRGVVLPRNLIQLKVVRSQPLLNPTV